ncbi:FMRFamide receptor [Biomphalaria glabrata]|nr:FMRFamide receptor [Biomphalaria glabrata]
MVNPWCLAADVPFVPIDFLTLVSFYPHSYFIRVSGFIASFASFERCLSVMVPLKVKTIITWRTSLVVNTSVFMITILNVFSPYYFSYLGWTFIPERNKTLLVLSLRGDWASGLGASYIVTDLFFPYFALFLLIACNVVTATKLANRLVWRASHLGLENSRSGSFSLKEKKVTRMLLVVSLICICCLAPQSTILTAVTFVSDIGLNADKFEVAFLCYCFSYLIESICSSINIFVYYNMSSKYRRTFQALFCNRQA